MKPISKTLSFDSRFQHLYRPLLRRLLVVFVATALLVQAALLFFDERLVRHMSSGLIENASEVISQSLKRMLAVSNESLMIAKSEVDDIPLDGEAAGPALFSRLAPFLRAFPLLDSINLADTVGNEFVVIRDGDGFLTRRTVTAEPETARWSRVKDGEIVESWKRATETRPSERPWFTGALQAEPGTRFWTYPYTFLTTNEPGISVATRWQPASGGTEQVIAFNLSLVDVSNFTRQQRPSPNGMSFAFNDARRIVGLPGHERFADERSIAAAELLPLDQLGITEIDGALAGWDALGNEDAIFSFRDGDDRAWWAGISRIRLDENHGIWSAALVPRSDLVGSIVRWRNLAVIGVTLLGILVAAGFLLTAMRAIRRQMASEVNRIEQKLGQYFIEDRIGSGGNGTVFRARHALLRRPTALKLMNPEFASSDAARERFEHEVRLTSGLSHPNTVAIYDFGRTADGTLYYAMELLGGSTLNRLVEVGGPLPASRTIHFLTQACGSLAEAHGKGLIHRDIKPSNLIVCERGGLYDVLKVVDFGLVKEIAQTDGNLTQADMLVGTPFFMAPETISKPGAAGPQSDLYALGAVGYFLLTGRHVFEGESAVEICAAHLHDAPQRPSEKAGRPVPDDLEAIVLRCLEKDLSARPASAGELRDALAACRDAGAWGSDDAEAWWREYGSGVQSHAGLAEAVPMSHTEMLVDLDSRLVSAMRPAHTSPHES